MKIIHEFSRHLNLDFFTGSLNELVLCQEEPAFEKYVAFFVGAEMPLRALARQPPIPRAYGEHRGGYVFAN